MQKQSSDAGSILLLLLLLLLLSLTSFDLSFVRALSLSSPSRPLTREFVSIRPVASQSRCCTLLCIISRFCILGSFPFFVPFPLPEINRPCRRRSTNESRRFLVPLTKTKQKKKKRKREEKRRKSAAVRRERRESEVTLKSKLVYEARYQFQPRCERPAIELNDVG